MRRISPVLLMLLGSLVVVAPGCGGDEGISKKPSKSQDAGDGKDDDSSNTSNTSGVTPTAGGTTTSAATSNTTNGQTSSEPLPAGTAIGIGCEDDSDCLAPLTCVREHESFRGTFPGSGVCTMPCTNDDVCLAIDSFGICGVVGAPTDEAIAEAPEGSLPEGVAGYCMQACYYGDSVQKCGELTTFTCAPLNDFITSSVLLGICVPLCYEDANCQEGEHCDTGSGLCLPQNGEGKAVGSDCDPSQENPGCAEGYCVAMTETEGFCSTNCTVRPETIICNGGVPGPDAISTCYPNMDVYFGTEGEVITSYGDLGQCWPLCDEDADCPANLVCDISSQEAQKLTGRQGLCFLPESSPDAGVPTPDAATREETTSNEETAGDGG